jgi:hypothetical protein
MGWTQTNACNSKTVLPRHNVSVLENIRNKSSNGVRYFWLSHYLAIAEDPFWVFPWILTMIPMPFLQRK